jgi:phosphoglycolate phosphatase
MGDLVVGFDLDMTLIDSRPGILATLVALSEETGVPIDGELVVSRLGPTLESEMAEWYAEERVPAVSDRFRDLYAELGVAGCDALPGANHALAAVRSAGARSIVITTKYEPSAVRCLEHVGLEVDDVIGWRYGPDKAQTLTEHGASAYVGDTPSDVAAAHSAGAVGVAVPTGPHPSDELRAAGADVVLDSLRDFPVWFARWRQAVEKI